MPKLRIPIPFTIRWGVAEAKQENPHFVLSFDYQNPDRIVAFLTPEVHREIAKQFAQTPRLDGVSIGASLMSLVSDTCEYLENETAVNQLIAAFEAAIQQVRTFQKERDAALKTELCERCGHPALDHYRPDSGEINCRLENCECSEFAPLLASIRARDKPTILRVSKRRPSPSRR